MRASGFGISTYPWDFDICGTILYFYSYVYIFYNYFIYFFDAMLANSIDLSADPFDDPKK